MNIEEIIRDRVVLIKGFIDDASLCSHGRGN
jgi:hypothetical protein